MSKFDLITQGTAIAANASSFVSNITQGMDTRTARKLRNKLGYDLQTLGASQQLIELMGLKGRNLDRAEALLDAFTIKAREDLLDI